MKKLLLLMFVSISLNLFSQDKVTYDYKTESTPQTKVKDFIIRKIYREGDRIIITNYFEKTGYSLELSIDQMVEDAKLAFYERSDNVPWFYCSTTSGEKYVLIGLGSKKVELYYVLSDVEVFRETFE